MADNENVKAVKDAEKETVKKKVPAKPKADKVPLGKRISKFFRDYKGEIKKISWPTWKTVVNNSVITIIAIAIIGSIIWIIDGGLTILTQYLFDFIGSIAKG